MTSRVEAVARAIDQSGCWETYDDLMRTGGYFPSDSLMERLEKSKDRAQAAIEASDAWLKKEHGLALDDVISAHWHRIETARRRAVWEGHKLPTGTTRSARVCNCELCSNWTYETPEDAKKLGPLP